MTNGLRFIEWIKSNNFDQGSNEYEQSFMENVLTPNCMESKSITAEIRKKTNEYVIDPACFDMPKWSQEKYLALWCAVIGKYSKKMIFNDGWHYSNGCVIEYVTAKELSLPTYDLRGKYIQALDAIKSISSSLKELSDLGLDISKMKKTLDKLKKYELTDVQR
ncbi:MAG: hypothetical protein CL942_08745 [Desulfovibrio sp.]|nr:hypothetical protein [Desulfovibrio sp.]|tara:strand:- start:515 stop:1003 length:489 start_codon:yes stop_codon:yes gene_type:complete